MSNAETPFTYTNFPFDIERVDGRAAQVVDTNMQLSEQNATFHGSLASITDADFRAIAQHELVADQHSVMEEREALADSIPYGALGPIRNTLIGRLDQRLEEFIAMQHQTETLRQQLQRHHQNAAQVEEVLGHSSSPTQRWLTLKAREAETRIAELQGSFETGEITRLVDGVRRINNLYHSAGEAWIIPEVMMPAQFPEVAFVSEEEPAAAPVVRNVPVQDRSVVFSNPADAVHEPLKVASGIVDPFTLPEQPPTDGLTEIPAVTQPESERKLTLAETISSILLDRPGWAVTSQDLALMIYGREEAEIPHPNGGKLRATNLTTYLGKPRMRRNLETLLEPHGLVLQKGYWKLQIAAASETQFTTIRQNFYRAVNPDNPEVLGTSDEVDFGEPIWLPVDTLVPRSQIVDGQAVAVSSETFTREAAEYQGIIAERLGQVLAHHPDVMFNNNVMAEILYGQKDSARRVGGRGSVRANQISHIVSDPATRGVISLILSEQQPPLSFQTGEYTAPVADSAGHVKRRPRMVYRSVQTDSSDAGGLQTDHLTWHPVDGQPAEQPEA